MWQTSRSAYPDWTWSKENGHFSEEKFPPLSVGDTITLSVPTVNPGPLDSNNIFGALTQFKNDVYRVRTKKGFIKGWFPRADIAKLVTNAILLKNSPLDTLLGLLWSSFLGTGETERHKKSTVVKVSRLRLPLRFSWIFPSNPWPEKLFKSLEVKCRY